MYSHKGTYTKKFEAEVTSVFPNIVELDQTAFYPLGGGQPADIGTIKWIDNESAVIDVRKKNRIRHMIEGDSPQIGEKVVGKIDWDRRYAHMKMHTSQHLISSVVSEMYSSDTVGNQIGQDKSRIDFKPLKITNEELSEIENKANQYISENLKIDISEELRTNLENNPDIRSSMSSGLWKMLPESVTNLRVISIGDIDVCPCAGTHVKSLKEIGQIKFIKKDNKGSQKLRLSYKLE